MHVKIDLDKDAAEKLTRIQQQTGQSIEQIISHALNLYYQQLQSQGNQK